MDNYDEYDAQGDEIMREIRDESMEYADNVHLAEEEGWFYPDDNDD